MRYKIKNIKRSNGAQFAEEDTYDIGKFLLDIDYKDRSTKNILEHIKDNPKEKIHDYIEWDDTIAGEKYRLTQVRHIVNHISFEYEKIYDDGQYEIINIPLFSSVSVEECLNDKELDEVDSRYVEYSVIEKEECLKRQVLKQGIASINSWLSRYSHYKEFEKISKFLIKQIGLINVK